MIGHGEFVRCLYDRFSKEKAERKASSFTGKPSLAVVAHHSFEVTLSVSDVRPYDSEIYIGF